MTDKVKIDANKLTEIRLSEDATRVTMTLLDASGQQVLLSLPANCLNAVVSVVPRQVAPDVVHRLDSWSMCVVENGQDLLLTLRTPEGVATSFTLKPWQLEGMATIATYGSAQRSQPKTMH
ncbi:MAG: hypothetical protein ABSE20_25485 [Acetobacteraceae bacterium]